MRRSASAKIRSLSFYKKYIVQKQDGERDLIIECIIDEEIDIMLPCVSESRRRLSLCTEIEEETEILLP